MYLSSPTFPFTHDKLFYFPTFYFKSFIFIFIGKNWQNPKCKLKINFSKYFCNTRQGKRAKDFDFVLGLDFLHFGPKIKTWILGLCHFDSNKIYSQFINTTIFFLRKEIWLNVDTLFKLLNVICRQFKIGTALLGEKYFWNQTEHIYPICLTTVECRTHTKTPALFSKLNLVNLVFREHFVSCTWVLMYKKRTKNNKIQNEQPAFGCQPAFGWYSIFFQTSFWESLPIADQQTFFFLFLHEPYMSLSYTWRKRYFFHHFRMFLIVFDHASACSSMRSLVEIHSNHKLKFTTWS